MLRLMLLTTAMAFAVASSVAVAQDKPPAKADDKPAAKADDQPAAKADSKPPAKAASKPSPKSRTARAAAQLPPGLPRAGYRYRTTVTPATPVIPAAPYRAPLPETDEALLITPAYGPEAYTRNLPGTPLLPGATTIPGYYGRPFSYDYTGPYYGGPYEGYYWRLPYACGVYGYC